MILIIEGRPPTLNSTYKVAGGRLIKTERAKAWELSALEQIMVQKSSLVPKSFAADTFVAAEIFIQPSDRRVLDADAALKVLFDILQEPRVTSRGSYKAGAGIIANDSQIRRYSVYMCEPTREGRIVVRLGAISDLAANWTGMEEWLGEPLPNRKQKPPA